MKPFKKYSAVFIVLIFAACAQTTATKTASPPQEETRQTAPAGSEASSQTSESGRPETRPTTPAGSEASAEPSDTGQQEPRGTSKTGEATSAEQAASPKKAPQAATAAGSESKKSSTGQASGQEASAEAKLAQARENLRISRETEKRIAAELAQLKASGSASEETVKDYETYLARVAAMTAENQKMVEQMEAAYAASSAAKTSANELNKLADPDIAEEQTVDEVAALDRQLNASLAKFDGMLLEEMDKIRAGSSKTLQNLAEEAAQAAKRLREKGLDVETSGSKSSDERREDREGRQGTEKASRENSGKGGEGPSATDQRRRGYEDDDIVARQLREAAENETDPELKEKLWKEYDEYKKSK